MNVKELIEHLNQFNPETQVMFSITDHTDWNSKLDIEKDSVGLGGMECDDDCEIELWDDNGEYIGPEVVLFTVKY
jgi:hypothetical protein